MRCLLIHKHFWPDNPPYATIIKRIGEHLVSKGEEVTVFTAQPSYGKSNKRFANKENVNGVNIIRIVLLQTIFDKKIFKYLDILYFPLRVFFYILKAGRYDILLVSTAPPVVLSFLVMLGARLTRAKMIYHCQDIHPEIGALSGEFSHPLLYRILLHFDNWTLKSASQVIVLSEDMKNALCNRKIGKKVEDKIQVLNNFSLPTDKNHININDISHYLKSKKNFRIIFAGNIGRFQGLEDLVLAVNRMEPSLAIELVFVGEGKVLSSLKKMADSEKIKFFPRVDVATVKLLIGNSDLGVVALKKNIIRYACPSKTMAYLEQGCPVLAIVEEESELAKFVSREKIGFVAEPENVDSIMLQLKNAVMFNQDRCEAQRQSIMQTYKVTYSEELFLSKFDQLLEEAS